VPLEFGSVCVIGDARKIICARRVASEPEARWRCSHCPSLVFRLEADLLSQWLQVVVPGSSRRFVGEFRRKRGAASAEARARGYCFQQLSVLPRVMSADQGS
jgi:hypothetical protein